MSQHPAPKNNTRIGFHYFRDTLHYSQSDLSAWLPELKSLRASWLTMIAPSDRAIPEAFIKGVLTAGIEPILHFHLSLDAAPKPKDLTVLLEAYASWGVHYITLFKRPNCHDEWPDNRWVQQDLVERFLDIYIPLAEAVCKAGMYPVFPPLEPGGDFWDTVFLRSALQSIQRRGHERLLERLAAGTYGWTWNRPLNWGAGGPERWPGARPYFTPDGEEDQIGFRTFDWYTTISQAVLDRALPILLLGMGARPGDQRDGSIAAITAEEHRRRNLQVARLLGSRGKVEDEGETLKAVPEHILGGCFWLLAANPGDPAGEQAWYREDGTTLPAADALKAWNSAKPASREKAPAATTPAAAEATPNPHLGGKPIRHYLLLPTYEWGVANWHLEVTRPFIKKYRPTVGFSVEEAQHAERVTVIGGEQTFPPEVIETLRAAGCRVEQIGGDGTTIATQLETL